MRNLLSNYPHFFKKIQKNQELAPKKLNMLNFHKIRLKSRSKYENVSEYAFKNSRKFSENNYFLHF